MPRYLLALDQGTTSSRSIVFDDQGRVCAMAQREFSQHFPQPAWVEHDAMEIWTTQLATARTAIAQAGLTAADIAAIGITNQRETTVVWDRRTGQPIHPAIVWQDRRTEPLCADLRNAGHAEGIRSRTGLVIDAYFSATKIAWILDHVQGARAAAERGELAFGTIDSWLLWQLTGGRIHATDITNASRTLLFNIHTGTWDDTLLALFKVPAALLPEVRPSSHVYGHTAPAHFGAPLPIGGVAGDQQSALFGQAGMQPGVAKNTYGTGCFTLLHTGAHGQTSSHGLITTRVAQLGPDAPPEFALEGSVFIGGAVVQWLRDGLHAIRTSGEVRALAESVPDNGGVVFVPAFTGLGAPYWDSEARGAIVGLTRGSTTGHIARAALESIAFQSADLLRAMNQDALAGGACAIRELRVDGGASANDLLMQFQADLLGIPVMRPTVIESTAWGAAGLAGLAAGVYDHPQELARLHRIDRRFEPQMGRDEAEARTAFWDRAIRQVRSR